MNHTRASLLSWLFNDFSVAGIILIGTATGDNIIDATASCPPPPEGSQEFQVPVQAGAREWGWEPAPGSGPAE